MLPLEVWRLLRTRRTWLFLAVFILAPLACVTGLLELGMSAGGGMTTVLVLKPAQRAVFVSGLAAALFVLMELQKAQQNNMDTILDAASLPVRRTLRQTAALLIVCLLAFLAAMLLVVPYTAVTMGPVFRPVPFAAAWGVLYFGGILIVALLSCGIYLLTRSMAFSFLLVGGLIAAAYALNSSHKSVSFLLYWLQSGVFTFSDATASRLQVELIVYIRLFWLCISAAVFLLGMCAVRRYGLNLGRSLARSARRVLPVLAILLLCGAALLMALHQPFFDNGPILEHSQSVDPETGIVVYQSDDSSFTVDDGGQSAVMLRSARAEFWVNTKAGVLDGVYTCTASSPQHPMQDLAFSMAPGVDIYEVTLNGKPVEYAKNRLDNFQTSVYHLQIPLVTDGELCIRYSGVLRNSRGNGRQTRMYGITEEFVFLANYFPAAMSGAIRTACTMHLPEGLTPLIAEVSLSRLEPQQDGYETYRFESFGYDWVFAGDYLIEEFEAGGMQVRFAYLRGRQEVIRETRAADTVADVINFFAETFGPLDYGDQPMVIAELDGSMVTGGWGLGSMSVFGEGLFMGAVYKGDEGAVSHEGGSGIGVAVHEIAHQWWGWSPDGVNLPEEPNTPWSGEGLTVYSSYLYMKSRFGEDFARENYIDRWRENTARMQNAFYLNHLEFASGLPQNDAAEIYSAFSSTTRYDMMPMLLLKAEALVGGEEAFLEKLREIHAQYGGRTLGYDRFLIELGLTREEMVLDES